METKRKSYLSKQVIAILVIVTVLVVSVPLYFFVLKPFLNRGDSVEETESEPLLEGEVRSSSTLYIHSVEESDEQLYRLYNSEKGDWGFYVKGGNYALDGYESISYTYELYTVHSALKKTPGKHIIPSSDMLKELRTQKAEKMDAAELEKLGGINNLILTEEDLKDVEIDYAEYGFEDFSKVDRVTTVDADGVEHTLYLGNTTPDGDGRYAVYKGRKMVYRLDSTASTCVGASMLNVVAPIFTEVAQSAASSSDYALDQFELKQGKDYIVAIKLLTSKEALSLDRTTKSIAIKLLTDKNGEPLLDENGRQLANYYDTSSEYMAMLYELFRQGINGTETVYAIPSVFKTVDGQSGYMHGDIDEKVLEQFGISTENPYRSFYTSKKYSSPEVELENALLMSAPQEDKQGRFYYAYNIGRGIIIKVYASQIPFVEKDEAYFISKFVSMLDISYLARLTVDCTALPEGYLDEQLDRFKESFTLDYKMNGTGTGKEVDEDGRPILRNILLSDGSSVPSVGDLTGIKNFRKFYSRLLGIRMYVNVEEQMEQIEKVDLDHPHVEIVYEVDSEDHRSHTLKFYFYDEAGIWAFYTLDGEGRYIARAEDVRKALIAAKLVKEGKSVTEVLGEATD